MTITIPITMSSFQQYIEYDEKQINYYYFFFGKIQYVNFKLSFNSFRLLLDKLSLKKTHTHTHI